MENKTQEILKEHSKQLDIMKTEISNLKREIAYITIYIKHH